MKMSLRLFALMMVLLGLEAPSQATGEAILQIKINIHPGSAPNAVNANTTGVIPVAIFSTDEFDATSIDPASLALQVAPNFILIAGADPATFEESSVKINKANRLMCNGEDVGSYDPDAFDHLGEPDGNPDLVCQFTTRATLFAGIEQPLQLTGLTREGTMIPFGTDFVVEQDFLFTVVKCCIVCEDDGSCSGCNSDTDACTDELVACKSCEGLSDCTGCEPPRVAQAWPPMQSFACLRP